MEREESIQPGGGSQRTASRSWTGRARSRRRSLLPRRLGPFPGPARRARRGGRGSRRRSRRIPIPAPPSRPGVAGEGLAVPFRRVGSGDELKDGPLTVCSPGMTVGVGGSGCGEEEIWSRRFAVGLLLSVGSDEIEMPWGFVFWHRRNAHLPLVPKLKWDRGK